MTPYALALVVSAGALHATWNLLLKGSRDPLRTGAWSLLVGALLFSPALVAALPVPPAVWPFVLVSAGLMVLYYAGLGWAYTRGDFSLVYPVARGTAPAFIALWAYLFVGERPSPAGLAGVGTILVGLVVLGGGPLWAQRAVWRDHAGGLLPAFLVALVISVYSVVDGAGVRHWEPVPYVVLTFAMGGAVLLLALGIRDRPAVEKALAVGWRRIAAIAALTLVAYSLVLRAYQIAPISYAGAAREIGIVFGALAGWLLLKERFGRTRTAGAVLVFLGIGVLALAT